MNTEFAQIFNLGRAERLQLVEDLWDSLAREEDLTPVPEWKRDELRYRKEQYTQNKDSGISWTNVKQRVRSQNG
jgi:putative addiction module component (TIGR02574 family)